MCIVCSASFVCRSLLAPTMDVLCVTCRRNFHLARKTGEVTKVRGSAAHAKDCHSRQRPALVTCLSWLPMTCCRFMLHNGSARGCMLTDHATIVAALQVMHCQSCSGRKPRYCCCHLAAGDRPRDQQHAECAVHGAVLHSTTGTPCTGCSCACRCCQLSCAHGRVLVITKGSECKS